MNQTVLLAGINDDERTLETLFRGLVRARVRPYYLLQADPGPRHRATCARRSRAASSSWSALQGRLSGIALPKFICDTPGGRGKVPLLADSVVAARARGDRRPSARFVANWSTTSIRRVVPIDGFPPCSLACKAHLGRDACAPPRRCSSRSPSRR